MIDLCNSDGSPNYGNLCALVIYGVIEFWLGKTNLVKAGSTFELILNGLKIIFRPKQKDAKMLNGKEIEGKIGDVGSYSLDVDDKGQVTISVEVEKVFDGGKAKSSNSVEVNIFEILEKIAAKTASPWDDQAVAMAEKLLGISKA